MSKISFKRIFVVLVGILTAMIVLHYAALKRLGTPITVGKIDITEMEKTKAYFDTLLEEYYPETEWDFTNAQNDLANGPTVQAQAALLVDLNTGELLFEKNSDEKRAIASLAKVMTAIIALEHRDLEDTIRISKKAAEIGENNMGISEGELYTLEELLYGLVLNSGNDSAYAIAENVAGDTETFVFWMNFKAEYEGKVEFEKIDVEADSAKAAQFGVMSIPTFVILKDDKEVARRMGAMPKETLKGWIDENL